MDIQVVSPAESPLWKELLPAITGFLGGAIVFGAQWLRESTAKKTADEERRTFQTANALRSAYGSITLHGREAITAVGAWAMSFTLKESPLAQSQSAEAQQDVSATLDTHRQTLDDARRKLREACMPLVFWEPDRERRLRAEGFDERLRKLMFAFMMGDGTLTDRFDSFGSALGEFKKDFERFVDGLAMDQRLLAV
jgi:hypothetical protein